MADTRLACAALAGVGVALLQQLVDAPVRELICALIAIVAGVPLDPVPLDVMAGDQRIESLPEVSVLHWFLVGRLPAAPLPLQQPLTDSIPQVLGVRVKRDAAPPLQRLEPADRGRQLHAVVGRQLLASPQLLLAAS